MRRHLISILACLGMIGCARFVPPSDSERSRSFQAYTHAQVSGQTLNLFLQQRTALIINGTVSVLQVAADGQTLRIRFKPEPGKMVNGPSHAIAIDSHGYFLTAAHCLDEPVMYLVYSDGRSARIAVPRVVAKVRDKERQLDFAIIHVDAVLPYVFTWSGLQDANAGRIVIAVGNASPAFASGTMVFGPQTCMAGRVASNTAVEAGAVDVFDNVPLRPGDSGGPLATIDGRLLGVNTGVRVVWTGSCTSVAIRPDPAWVARTIAEDMKQPREQPPTIPYTLPDKLAAHVIVTLW